MTEIKTEASSPEKANPVNTLEGTTTGEQAEKAGATAAIEDNDLAIKLDGYALEAIVELKISRFLDQIGTYYPENLHSLIIRKVEKPLINQILRRTGGNQVHAARILGINRNTLRKKMKMYSLC
ncbi:MAG: helix-turn-helix domain-containing protein [Bdellovibrionota bacterium]